VKGRKSKNKRKPGSPQRCLHLGGDAKAGCGVEKVQWGGKSWKEVRCKTAHLSVHLDGLGLQGSAPPRPERLVIGGARPPGIPARPQPQLARVAPHHEEAPILGQRRTAAVQCLCPDLAESPGREQCDQGE
jgi:hypothetical protein